MIRRYILQLLCLAGLFCSDLNAQELIVVEYSVHKTQVSRALRIVRTFKPDQRFDVFGQTAVVDHYEIERVVNEFFDGWVVTVWFLPV